MPPATTSATAVPSSSSSSNNDSRRSETSPLLLPFDDMKQPPTKTCWLDEQVEQEEQEEETGMVVVATKMENDNNNNGHHQDHHHNHLCPLMRTTRQKQQHPLLLQPQRRQRPILITPAYRQRRYEVRKHWFGCLLAALSAYADILCYHRFGYYGNMMTGNTIKLMDAVASGRWDEAQYLALLVPSYVVGAALCTLLNRLDLIWLGLGGPSDSAFEHLQPPRRLRSPQEISVLRVVAIASVLLFFAGEVVVVVVSPIGGGGAAADRWRLPFFACAFGLLNAATLAAIHIVTNAVTGHWITVGVGVADDWPTLLNNNNNRIKTNGQELEDEDDDNDDDNSSGGSLKKWQSSMSVAASFIVAIVVTSLLYNECQRQAEHHPDWPLAIMFVHGPPMGVIFGIVYAALLYWYTLPPPFLQGYTSQVNLANF